jgi:VanZ family protein
MATLLRINDRFWPVFTVIALIAVSVLSLVPLATPLPAPVSSDKLHHFVAYSLVALPVALARPRYWFFVVLSFALWSIVIELVQPFVGRTRAAADVAANVGGLVVAIAASGVFRQLGRARRLTRPGARSTKPAPGSSAHGRR